MTRPSTRWQHLRLLIGSGLVSLGLAMVAPAQAGGVDLSIGIGLPIPMVIGPAPVVVTPSPVMIPPAPMVVSPPAVVVQEPPVVYGRPWPPGLAKQYSGYPPAYGRTWHRHKHHGWHDDD
jgi:hypothetical protein